MYLSPEDREVGKTNFCAAIGSQHVRPEFLMKAITSGARSKQGLGPLYFGYEESLADPVRVGVIGTGDEGCVLIGALNPKFVTVKAIADIRPYNIWRAFHGDHYSETARKARPGLLSVFGWKSEEEARKHVAVYGPYEELIGRAKEDGLEAVIIALPLHLHAPASIAALKAGLHVLTEKLMGHSVHECKEMARAAAQTGLLLATGHQRHYNILYRQAVKLTRAGLLGQVHYIRAQWHRGNLPGADSWQQPMPRKVKPDDPLAEQLDRQLARYQRELKKAQADFDEAKKAGRSTANLERRLRDLQLLLDQVAAQIRDEVVDAAKYGYQDLQIKDAAGKVLWNRPAIEELIRWRLWDRTGGGLMAELGSHQLDAASIFISALFEGEKKQIPLSVTALAHRPLFPPDRDVEDHVYCIFEFPAPGHDPHDPRAKDQKITVQYASINGNGFGGYGETVLGTEGTLLLETEKEALLFKGGDTGSKTRVVLRGKKPVLVADKAGDVEAAAIGQLAVLPAERGYTEQIEHWAWCIRNPAPENQPRCGPKVALGDAVIALTTNIAARKGARIDFDPAWFEIDSDATPEGIKPDLSRYS